MASHLRVFPLANDVAEPDGPPATVRVSLGDLLPLMALAHRQNYLWLRDFLDDEVCITEDLYEVLRTFSCHRPSAG
jgi:hypothetical protein